MRRIITLLLLIGGVQLVLLIGAGQLPPPKLVLWAIAAAAAVGVGISCAVRKVEGEGPAEPLTKLRDLTNRSAGASPSTFVAIGTALLLFVASCTYLFATAKLQHRTFSPAYEDEFSYILQAKMLASFRLWTAKHELADFFESFQIVTEPVYASIYFPGAAMVYAIGEWFSAPHWVVPLFLSGCCVVLLQRIVAMLFGEPAGWTAAVMLVGLTIFRLQSIMSMAQIPVLCAGLLMTWTWLRWRQNPRMIWMVVLGAAAGWAMITRPVDGLCFTLPLGAAVLLDLWPRGSAVKIKPIGVAVLAALPFLSLQLIQNYGVTGSIFHTPFQLYADLYNPGTNYGFNAPPAEPKTALPQKIAYYNRMTRPLLREHSPAASARLTIQRRIPETIRNGLPHAVLFALLPVGLLALRRVEVAVVVAPLFLLPMLYWPYAFRLPHYTLSAAPAVIVLALAGVEGLVEISGRFRTAVRAFGLLGCALVSVAELPEFNRTNFDEYFPAPQVQTVAKKIEALPREPAIVLFRWSERGDPQEEPVYNISDWRIDRNLIIRAHDLGARNMELIKYYQRVSPRAVYLYDRADDSITLLDDSTAE